MVRTGILPGTVAEASPLGLHVSGNRLLKASESPVHLHGVNRAGTEYACVQNCGIFDGPSDDASIAAIRSWPATSSTSG
jgi:endoglucanase